MTADPRDSRIPLEPGTLVEGPRCTYRLEGLLGRGGFSLLYLARQEDSGRRVALKELYPRALEGAVARRRAEGTIVLSSPLTGREDSPELWQELEASLAREVVLTRKAGAVYTRQGDREV